MSGNKRTFYINLSFQMAFRVGTSTKLDDRTNALEMCKNLPLKYLLQEVYPDLYPVHMLDENVSQTFFQ